MADRLAGANMHTLSARFKRGDQHFFVSPSRRFSVFPFQIPRPQASSGKDAPPLADDNVEIAIASRDTGYAHRVD